MVTPSQAFLTRLLAAALLLASASMAAAEDDPDVGGDWKIARTGWEYRFPNDEFAHPDFKTEWWYFTGNLATADQNREFGYQLTFFRQGIRPPGGRHPVQSRFVVDDFWFAHFAVSDLSRNRFLTDGRVVRGSFDEAGSHPAAGPPNADAAPFPLVWLRNWTLESLDPAGGHYRLQAESGEGFAIDFELHTSKPPVFHGHDGISPKSPGPGNASHYYSFTRLQTKGALRLGTDTFEVSGQSWYDREWSTSVLRETQVGWDWFSLQFDDGRELMLFQLRDASGRPDYTSGTWIEQDGTSIALAHGAFRLTPGATWSKGRDEVAYPVTWEVELPERDLKLQIKAAIPAQELQLAGIAYWEGAIRVTGTEATRPLTGKGYLEMTGYRGAIPGLGSTLRQSP